MNWQTGQSIFAVCMMMMAAWAVGCPVVRRVRVLDNDPAGRALWALVVGGILWGLGLAGLGLLGLLYVPLVGGLTWAAFLVGFYQLVRGLEASPPSSWPGKHLLPAAGASSVRGRPGAGSECSAQATSPLPAGTASPIASEAIPAKYPFFEEEVPAPYEHAPPPDLVAPGGLPVWAPEWTQTPAGPLESGLPPDAEADDWELLPEEPAPAAPAPNAVRPAAIAPAGRPRRRVDPPGHAPFWQKQPAALWPTPPDWLAYLVFSLAAGGVLAALAAALAPPTAGDALCYHLELPKRFLQSHRLDYLPYDDACTYPLLAEMWFLWALALDGEVAAQLVHWQWGLLFAWAAVQLAQMVVDRRWAWLAGAVVLLTPGVLNEMTAPLNDVALAAMTTLSLTAWAQACQNSVGAGERKEWFLLAGLALGGAASIKYTVLLIAPCLAALWALRYGQLPDCRRMLLHGAVLTGLVALSVSGVWYLRAAWHRGNPVYPLAQAIWPSRIPPPKAHQPADPSPVGQGRGLAGLADPWSVTMQPELFGGRSFQLGAVWLAVLPGLFWTQTSHRLKWLLGLAGIYFLLWAMVRPNVRFLLPILPMLAPGVIWVWAEMRRMPGWPRTAAAAAVGGCLLVPVAWMGLRMRDYLPVALGLESRQEFLYRREPSYPAAALANLLLPPDAKILSQDYRSFYFDPVVVRESVYRRLTRYDQKVQHPADLVRLLRLDGFTHLLLVEEIAPAGLPKKESARADRETLSDRGNREESSDRDVRENLVGQDIRENVSARADREEFSDRGIRFDPTLSRLAEAALALPDPGLQELSQYRFTDADGSVRRYRLIAIH